MTYIITQSCVDLLDKTCVGECPVDCIYEGERMLYIHPDECIDCGACEPVCPVEAIYYEDDVPDQWSQYTQINTRLRIYPCPERIYVLEITGNQAPPIPQNDTDTNFWTTDASALIINSTCSEIYAGYLHNPERAQVYLMMTTREKNRLMKETLDIGQPRIIRPYL